MRGTWWIVGLWAIAIVSAAVSFFVWSRLARGPSRGDLVPDGGEELEPESDREPENGSAGEPTHLEEAEELDSDQPVR